MDDAPQPPKYDAFLSYSHAVDRRLAPALQHAVQRFATPWYRLRSVRVFRDQTGLGADSGLWSAIERALTAAGWFVLLASPEAARSPWVSREVRWWLERNGPRRLLIVVTSGHIGWDEHAGRFSTDSDAVPEVLHRAYAEEPRWLDLRGVRQVEQLDRRLPAFAECVADLAATLRGADRDVLTGEDVRLLRRSRMLASGGVAGLAVLAAATTVLAVAARRQAREAVAAQQRAEAAQQRAEAAQRRVVARTMAFRADGLLDSDPRTALRLGAAAAELDPDPDNRSGLVRNLLASPYLGHTEEQQASVVVALAADARTLATVPYHGSVALWHLDGRVPPRPLGASVPDQELRPSAGAISPDGATLAVAGLAELDRCLELWDITDATAPRKLAGPLAGHPGGGSDLAFTPDGSRLVSVGQNDGSVIVWDVRDRSDPRRIGAPALLHRAGIMHVDVSPDGLLLATASLDGTAALSALEDDGVVRPLAHPIGERQDMMFAARFDPTGTVLATAGSDRTVRLFDIAEPTDPHRRGEPVTGFGNAVVDLAFRTVPGPPPGVQVACAGADGRIGLFDVTDADRPLPVVGFGGHGTVVNRVVFGGGGRTLVSGGAEGAAIAWDPECGDQGERRTLAGSTGQVAWVGFTPDGRRVGAVAEDGALRIWDPDRPAEPEVVPLDPEDPPSAAAFVDDARLLVGTECGHVLAVTAGVVTELQAPHIGRITAVAVRPGLAATCSVDGSVVLWRTAALDAAAEVPCGPLYPVQAATFTADGRILVLGGEAVEERLSLWDVDDPARPRRLTPPPRAHNHGIVAVAVAARRPLLATGSTDTSIVLWDMADPTRPTPLGNPIRDLRAVVQSLALDPDGDTLVAGLADGRTALFDLTDVAHPALLASRKQRLGGPRSVAFAPVGRRYAVGGQDDVVTVVDLARMDAVRRDPVSRARERAGGGLDRAQWEAFAPGTDHLAAGGPGRYVP